MRILFAATADIAVPTLERIASEFEVGLVLTNPDSPGKRGRTLLPTPVKQKALELGLPVFQPERLRGDALKEVASYDCDVLLCFAYGKIFGPKFMSMFPMGCYNIHPSLLPQFRGCAPVQYTILEGLEESGVTIQKLALKMDEGDIGRVDRYTLDKTETTASLTERIASFTAPNAVQFMHDLEDGKVKFVPQTGEPSWCDMIQKSDAVIDWNESAELIHRKIRAHFPWPKSNTMYKENELFITAVAPYEFEDKGDAAPGTVVRLQKKKGIAIACGDGLIWVTSLQIAKRKEMDYMSFVNGNRDFIGSVLGGAN